MQSVTTHPELRTLTAPTHHLNVLFAVNYLLPFLNGFALQAASPLLYLIIYSCPAHLCTEKHYVSVLFPCSVGRAGPQWYQNKPESLPPYSAYSPKGTKMNQRAACLLRTLSLEVHSVSAGILGKPEALRRSGGKWQSECLFIYMQARPVQCQLPPSINSDQHYRADVFIIGHLSGSPPERSPLTHQPTSLPLERTAMVRDWSGWVTLQLGKRLISLLVQSPKNCSS